jgi:hypothetical protein
MTPLINPAACCLKSLLTKPLIAIFLNELKIEHRLCMQNHYLNQKLLAFIAIVPNNYFSLIASLWR